MTTVAMVGEHRAEGLPEGWAACTLGEVVELKYGKGLVQERRRAGSVPVYGSNGIIGQHNQAVTTGPTIIVGRKGSVGEVNLSRVPCWPVDTSYYVDDFGPFRCAYLAYALRALRLGELDRSTAIPGLSREQAYAQELPVPPLAEQERIVAKVEELLVRVNMTRERLAKVSAILKRFRQSVLAAACSGQLTADWRDRHVSEPVADTLRRLGLPLATLRDDLPLSELPDRWMWLNLRSLMDRREAFCYGVVQPGADDPSGVPLVRAGDLDGSAVDMSKLRRIPTAVDAAYGRSRLRGGELLVTVVGAGIGESAIAPATCAGFNIARAVAKIPIRQFSAKYVLLWLQTSTARTWMDSDAREVARPTLNLEQLQTLPVPLPPLDEQEEVVRRASALLSLADNIEARVQAATARVEGITQAIVAKAFRGELVPTEAQLARQDDRDYEPASVLLGRISASRRGSKGVKPQRMGQQEKEADST